MLTFASLASARYFCKAANRALVACSNAVYISSSSRLADIFANARIGSVLYNDSVVDIVLFIGRHSDNFLFSYTLQCFIRSSLAEIGDFSM